MLVYYKIQNFICQKLNGTVTDEVFQQFCFFQLNHLQDQFSIQIQSQRLVTITNFMKNYKNQVLCTYHKQPITKIDQTSKKLLCPQCQYQTQQQFKNRLEVLRSKINTNYLQELSKLKNIKEDVEKISDMFVTHNMVDAKRRIKKQLPAVQQLVDSVLDREVQEANKVLRNYIEKLLKPWNCLIGDNKKLQLSYLQFEKNQSEIQQQIQEKKKQLKEGIAGKLKIEVAQFYCKIFQL